MAGRHKTVRGHRLTHGRTTLFVAINGGNEP